MNTKLFLLINGWAGKSHALDVVGIFFADKFLYISALAVALLWFYKPLRNYVYLAVGSSFVSRIIIVEIIKRIAHHPRPFEVLNVHQLLIDNERGNSFPSGHAVVYFALAFSFYGTKLFWPMIMLATLGAIARVFTGVHYPADIIASCAIAAITVWSIRRLFKKSIIS